jgi:hypothetical protein
VVSEEAWGLLREVWLMQVVREVGRKRAKAAKAAAARTAAGVVEDAGAGDDGEQQLTVSTTWSIWTAYLLGGRFEALL